MFKKTLLASALTLLMASATQGVQANPLTNMVNGLIGDAASSIQFDARRGGGRRAAPRPAPRPSVKSSTPARQTTSTSDNKTSSQDSKSTAQNNNQKDAQFSQNPNNKSNTTTNNQQQTQQPQMAQQPTGGMGMGSSFLSSLAGAGAGVLLANMLLSPSAAAAQGTEVATPDMLSDDQLSELLAEVEGQVRDAEMRLLEASPEDETAIRDEISQLNDLKISVMKEQLNRLQNK